MSRARAYGESDVGRIVIVLRHPRTGRETRSFGGAALFQGKRVLDIGTGNGRLAFEIAPFARSVTGIDPSDGAIALARDAAARRHVPNVTFEVRDAQTLRGIRGPFDVTLFSWSL